MRADPGAVGPRVRNDFYFLLLQNRAFCAPDCWGRCGTYYDVVHVRSMYRFVRIVVVCPWRGSPQSTAMLQHTHGGTPDEKPLMSMLGGNDTLHRCGDNHVIVQWVDFP